MTSPPPFEVLFIYELAFLFQYITHRFHLGQVSILLVAFFFFFFFFLSPQTSNWKVAEENYLVNAVGLLFVSVIWKGKWK